jgi:acetamidase/formamidase
MSICSGIPPDSYGTVGVAPAEEGDFHPIFPRNDIGGNIDCRYIGEGSTLYLPMNVPGALFAVGDAHFAQGDGEICVERLSRR